MKQQAANQPLGGLSKKKGTRRSSGFPLVIAMVPKGGLEPPQVRSASQGLQKGFPYAMSATMPRIRKSPAEIQRMTFMLTF